MEQAVMLARVLERALWERGYTLEQLHAATGVPKQTLSRWLRGEVAHPHPRLRLLKVAATLRLSRARTNLLLQAAGQPPIEVLWEQAGDAEERAVLAAWEVHTPTNLPSPLTSFVGREADIIELAELLGTAHVRLVTLTGPGGSGKTRLAIEVARALLDIFEDGVFFVGLSALSDPTLVLPLVTRTLGLAETAAAPPERLSSYLAARRVLLLLDNFEQVLDAGPDLTALLAATSQVKALVTSRVPLHVSGEHIRPVVPLAIPDGAGTMGTLRQNPAVALFAARAQAVNPQFLLTRRNAAAVAEICSRLDGLPLAIELAAARSRQFAPQDLLTRFPSRLALGSEGPADVPARQRALQATVEWSYLLLQPDDRRLFAHMAVFVGGWRSDAAVAIGQALAGQTAAIVAGLERLCDANLIRRTASRDGTPRFAMLETIHEYAVERVHRDGAGSAEAERLQRAHAAYFLAIAESAQPYVPFAQQDAWLDRIDQEHDNVRAALTWALEHREAELALRLAGALWPFWHEYGYYREGSRWLEATLALSDGSAPAQRAQVLTGLFLLTFSLGDHRRARAPGDAALALWRELDDRRGQAIVLTYRGLAEYNAGHFDAAIDDLGQGLAHWRARDAHQGIARSLAERAFVFCNTGRYADAQAPSSEALTLYERENDAAGIARVWTDRGLGAMFAGHLDVAIPLLERGVALGRELRGTTLLPAAVFYLGLARLLSGEDEVAYQHLAESLRLRQRMGETEGISFSLLGLAAVASHRGEFARAARLAGAALALQERGGFALPPSGQAIYQRETQAARNKLGDAVFAALLTEGQQMTEEAAIREALG